MKTEGLLFAGCAVFFAIVDIVYWTLSRDPTGTTALALAVGLAFLVGFYLFVTGRRTGMRPEDRRDAEISESAGEFGFFSPHSWWPLFTAASVGCRRTRRRVRVVAGDSRHDVRHLDGVRLRP